MNFDFSHHKAILWDMDGVLVNSEALWEKNYSKFFQTKFGVDYTPEDYQAIMGKTVPEIYRSLLPKYPALRKFSEADYVRAEFDYGIESIYPKTTLYSGVGLVLKRAKDLGLRQVVVSSSPMIWIEAALKKHDLNDYFDELVSGFEEGISKPDPDIYTLGAKRVGVPSDQCLVIEDSGSGIKAGVGAGMTVIGYRNGHNQSVDMSAVDFEINDFNTLLS